MICTTAACTALPTKAPVPTRAVVAQVSEAGADAALETAVATAVATTILTPTSPPPQTPTPQATASPTPTAILTVTPSPTPTPGPCVARMPGADLLTLVTKTYGLSRDFAPTDLVSLNDYLPTAVTLGYPTDIREPVVAPLVAMIDEMVAAGLQPQILSGYRSYAAQAIAYDKWLREEPERASILSAPPGHSEHQLGTTLDFGSPELPEITGIEDIQFHTYFYQTSEGIWLLDNAYRFGFTLSYPREAYEITGFYYEPWHYRYVGVEMATQLKEMNLSLTEYLLISQPEPCIP